MTCPPPLPEYRLRQVSPYRIAKATRNLHGLICIRTGDGLPVAGVSCLDRETVDGAQLARINVHRRGRRNQVEKIEQVVGLWEGDTLEREKCLEVFLRALLPMKAHRTQRTILAQRERMLGILEILLGFLDPLPRQVDRLRPRVHREPSLRAAPDR